jgi:hypothetical protein
MAPASKDKNRSRTMNRSPLLAVLFTVCTTPCQAGAINVVHLGPPEAIRFHISAAGTGQDIELKHGACSGGVILPNEKNATVSRPGSNINDLTLPASEEPRIVVLIIRDGEETWQVIPGKPTEDKWSLRAINLDAKTAVIVTEVGLQEVVPGAKIELPAKSRRDMAIRLADGEPQSYVGDEPCSVVALIHRKGDAWQVLFVPDR